MFEATTTTNAGEEAMEAHTPSAFPPKPKAKKDKRAKATKKKKKDNKDYCAVTVLLVPAPVGKGFVRSHEEAATLLALHNLQQSFGRKAMKGHKAKRLGRKPKVYTDINPHTLKRIGTSNYYTMPLRAALAHDLVRDYGGRA